MAWTISTNWHPRKLYMAAELPTALIQREEWSFRGNYDALYELRFFKYRNAWYDIQDFPAYSHPFNSVPEDIHTAGWDGFQSDSMGTGIAVRYPRKEDDYEGPQYDYENVIVGFCLYTD